MQPCVCRLRQRSVLFSWRRYSRKNDRITSPEDLLRPVVREANAYAATNASKKWDDTLDPISGGRKPPSHPRHKKSIVLSNNQRRPPPYRHKDKHETAPDDRTEYLYGVSPVYIALLAGRRDISEAFIQEGLLTDLTKKKKDPAVVSKIVKLCEQRKIPIKYLSKHDLNMLTDSKPHQGLVLRTTCLSPIPITALPRAETFKCVLALDEVTDPQNLGALIRSFHFLSHKVSSSDYHQEGAAQGQVHEQDAVSIVMCQKNSAPLSPTVSKASSGALENMNIHSTKNMMKFLEKSKENGWHVVGTSSHSMSREVVPLHALPLDNCTPIVVVLGNEGYGVRKNILNRCETLVTITSKGGDMETANRISRIESGDCESCPDTVVQQNIQELAHLDYVDSLNVSVCGGIILHHILLNSTSN